MAIKKARLVELVEKRIPIKVDPLHIASIISILSEEICQDIVSKGKFTIKNFGTFILRQVPSRKFFNFQTQQVEQSVGNKQFQFRLTKSLRKLICDNINIDKTFKEFKQND